MENIKVAARVRPFSEWISDQRASCVNVDRASGSIALLTEGHNRQFNFNAVFDGESTQEFIYAKIGQPIVEGFVEGINGTVFAYGQTGSGKTYTMMGADSDVSISTKHRGIIPRSLESAFEFLQLESRNLGDHFRFSMKCSFLELYNEKLYDLLGNQEVAIQLKVNGNQVVAYGANEFSVDSCDECLKLIQQGLSQRRVAETAMNRESSRSHVIFMLTLETDSVVDGVRTVRESRLNLVDLAGSERQRDTKSNADRLKEAGSINKSLSTLARVIRTLASQESCGKKQYVSYRDSNLTHLLKDSLGGNARTAVVVNIHPNVRFIGDTLSTLQFAENVKKVKNSATANVNVTCDDINLYKKEIARLTEELREAKTNVRVEPVQEVEDTDLKQQVLKLTHDLHEQQRLLRERNEECFRVKRRLDMASNTIKFLQEQIDRRVEESPMPISFDDEDECADKVVFRTPTSSKRRKNRRRTQFAFNGKPLIGDEPKTPSATAEWVNEMSDVKTMLADKETKLNAANEELVDLKEKLDLFRSRIDDADAIINRHETMRAAEVQRIKELEKELSNANERVMVLSEEKDNLEGQIITLEYEYGSLKTASQVNSQFKEEDVSEFQKQIDSLEASLAASKLERREMETQKDETLKQLMNNIQKLEKKLKLANDNAMALKQDNEDLEGQIVKLSHVKEGSADEHQKRIENLEASLTAVKAERKEMETQKEEALKYLKGNIKNLEKELNNANDRVMALSKEKDILEEQVGSFKTASKAESQQREEEVSEFSKKISCLEANLKAVKVEKKEIEAQRDEALKDLAINTGHMNHNQKIQYVEKLRIELQASQTENAKLKAQLKKAGPGVVTRAAAARGKENSEPARRTNEAK